LQQIDEAQIELNIEMVQVKEQLQFHFHWIFYLIEIFEILEERKKRKKPFCFSLFDFELDVRFLSNADSCNGFSFFFDGFV
jgi:hypothetical protein